MRHCVTTGLVVAGTLFAIAWGKPAVAQSAGCYKMPSRVSQFFGYGYGAGHHAPIIRATGHRPERVPHTVFVPPSYGSLCPAAYEPIGCYGEGCHLRTDGWVYPALAPVETQPIDQNPHGVRSPTP